MAAELAAAAELLRIAREGAAFPKRPKFILGPEGRGWLARAEAEYRRASGDNDPEAWQAVLDAFGPVYAYETARTRWRLAEALAEAGRRDEAAEQWHQAAQTADRLAARPLRRALDDLARRARIGTAEQRGDGEVLAALTSREREVLRLIAAGRSNRRSLPCCSSRRRQPACTCPTSSASSAPPAAPRPPPSPTARASSRSCGSPQDARDGTLTTIASCVDLAITTTASVSGEGFSSRCGTCGGTHT